jgi:hypothetical protein
MSIRFASGPVRSRRPIGSRLAIQIAGLSLALASCTAGPEAPARVRITGTVRDSLNFGPVSGQRVFYGAASTVTDALGRFSLTVSPRPDTLRVPATAWYGEYRLPLPGIGDTTVEIHLWRLVPFVGGFSVTPAGVLRVGIYHQPGAARVMRDSSSWVVYFSPSIGQSRAIPASEWTWHWWDDQSWTVSVSTGDATVTSALWCVSDSTFGSVLARCTPGLGRCTEVVP